MADEERAGRGLRLGDGQEVGGVLERGRNSTAVRGKDLRFFADRASKKWPLRGSLKESGVRVAYLA
jgi:hypothetical protein